MSNKPIVHFEIASTNPEAASKFYSELFGWEIVEIPDMDGYRMFQPSSGPGGAITQAGETYFNYTPETVLIYVGSDDVDETLRRAEALGATVLLPKTEIPGTGYFGILKDPTGNNIGVYQQVEE